jgi:sodium-dependent dicarboxylate transporter 2/3/5
MDHSSEMDIGSFSPGAKRVALIGAPLLAFVLYWLLPTSYISPSGAEVAFSHAGRACISVVVWMAIWWFMEPVPIAATSMLPIVLFPLLQVTTAGKAMGPYASSTVFLFLGGFLIAIGVARWGLDRRIALTALKIVGTKPAAIVGGLMAATAFMSMWISNTACAAMMVPIAMAVLNLVRSAQRGPLSQAERNFGVCLLLGIAYGASIGGMGTIIGSPPNGIYVRFMEQTYGVQISLLDWMKVGLPVMIVLLPVCWLVLTKVLFRSTIGEVEGGREWVANELKNMGPMSKGERVVLGVFCAAVFLWTFGGLIRGIEIGGTQPFKPLTDAVIAMACGVSLFCLPVGNGKMAITWHDCADLSWDVLLLFGGGLSMAGALQATGAGALIGAQAAVFAGAPVWIVILGVCALITVTTNFTSNTALAATMMPLLGSVAPVVGIPENSLLLVCALSCSAAFIMPVGTPPNAIIFSTGRISIIQMVRAGIVLSICSTVIISAFSILFLA